MQLNAATNLPKLVGSVALASANDAAAAGKSVQDTALSKTLLGTAGATNVGIGATKANQIQLQAGNTTHTFAMGANDTVSLLMLACYVVAKGLVAI